MLKSLIKIANKLDQMQEYSLADEIDVVLRNIILQK